GWQSGRPPRDPGPDQLERRSRQKTAGSGRAARRSSFLARQAGSVANPYATPAGANAFGGPAIRAVIAVVSEERSAEEAAPMIMEIAGKPAAMVEVAPIEVAAAEAATTASAATPASCERVMGEADAAKREDRSNGRNFE